MEKHAVVIIYHGTEASREAVRGAIEALIRHGVNMETQTVSPHVLNEKEIAMGIIGFSEQKDVIDIGPTFDDLCTKVCIEIKKDPRIERTVNRYILSRIGCIDNEFSKNIDSIVETNLKLQFVKAIKEKCDLSLKEAADLVDALYDIVQTCQERIVE